MTLRCALVEPEALHDLRRRVLRNNDPAADVGDPRDHEAQACHLGGFIGDRLVCCASVYPSTSPLHPDVPTYQLRYVATDFDAQGQGYGAQLMAALEDLVRERGALELWANGRDTALGFYQRLQWHLIPGSEHLSPYTNLPHTVIWKSLHEDDR
jgi:GNAT superfamily N-acetyltransferase